MNFRRPFRLLVLALAAASFAACHFHHHHCGPRFVPIRHCR
jgi:hypothetical protein